MQLKDNDQLNAIVQSAPIGICILDAATLKAELLNDKFLEIAGKPKEAIIDKWYWEPFAEAQQYFESALAHVAKTGEAYYADEVELMLIRHGREEMIFVTFVYAPVKDDAGTVTKVAVWVLENTKQVRERQAVSASEQRLRALVVATSDVIYSVSADWEVMHELDGRGFLKDTQGPMTGWRHQNVHPDDMDKVNAAIDLAIRTKTIFQLEHKVLRADGSPGWTFSRAVPILDAQGEIVEWFGMASDITEDKENIEALQQAKEQSEQQKRLYETITSGTPDLMYVFDLDYRFTYVNAALLTMWGKSAQDAIGKGLRENGYEEWHALMHEREIDQIKLTKKSIRGEVAFPHAVLGKRIYDYILIPVINAYGEVEAVAGTTRDITELREIQGRLEEELKVSRELQRLKDDFISMVSHELKTPLTSLSALLQIIALDPNNTDSGFLSGAIEKSIKRVKSMTAMINNFLDISRFESGVMQIDKSLFDLNTLITEVLDEVRLTIKTHRIVFTGVGSIDVYADRDKINSVISNLVNNAVKYSPEGKAVEVHCSKADGKITVSVKDEGVGISPGEKGNIFDRYYRVKNPNKYHIGGFGIGLYLSAQIVGLHAGKIWVESEPGKGSVFQFTLPI